ncbi:hypothetical protein PIB30_033959 [Stylosanthes scabra]|uniref:DUF4283 domain-containing protein n=1 Tax=Stylosanthes scabra TaxID=79078 RepID=A0ABU6QD85_9FABA|nr:hypothetical protein [Stylosanthes scabra]
MGMPVTLWSKEKFNKIAMNWGKVVMHDDRSELSKSYSVARIMIDSFHWELINEWVSISVDGRIFEVFVKETRAKSYSVQSHPDMVEDDAVSVDQTPTMSLVAETQPMGGGNSNLNTSNVGDPLFDTIMMEKSSWKQLTNEWRLDQKRPDDLGSQIVQKGISPMKINLIKQAHEKQLDENSASFGSCSFPPGFGPCLDQFHIHRELIGANPDSPDDRVVPILEIEPTVNESGKERRCRSSEEEKSDETRYKIAVEDWRCEVGVGDDDVLDQEVVARIEDGPKTYADAWKVKHVVQLGMVGYSSVFTAEYG